MRCATSSVTPPSHELACCARHRSDDSQNGPLTNRTPVRILRGLALVAITPVAASVDWDAQGTRPTRIRFGDRDVMDNRVSAVRDERAAFPAASGPNLRVVVEADSGDALELIFDVRRKRWFVDALDAAA